MTQVQGIGHCCFSENILDVSVHFQIVHLGRQLFIWIGSTSTHLGNLYLAGTTRQVGSGSKADRVVMGVSSWS